ncbi:SLC13 family permease [Mesotoga sp. UBA6090]|uniref:SLC13 family permease n=1 Tax=Mesotoga sp. UBA6090 TaxID=1946860 RepID=UPI0025CCDD23|nr:SLC13 family permease [Mesotoga sp. UBA6090]
MRLVDRVFIVIYFILTFTLIVLSKRRRVLIAFTAGMLLVVLKVSETMRIETISEFVDFNAIFLLIGMMVIVGVLKSTGFFQYVAVRTLRATKGNILLLSALFSAIIALFSMVLDNVTTMIMFMPIIFFVADTAGFNPFGFTAVMILASNIGGCMTLVGDPPNIIIGNASKIPFMTFSGLVLAPLLLTYVILMLISRFKILKSLSSLSGKKEEIQGLRLDGVITNRKLMYVCLGTLVVVVTGFIMHSIVDIEMSLFAVLGASFLLLYTGKDFESVATEVDWNAILFFIGLFSLAHSLESTGITGELSALALSLSSNPAVLSMLILWVSGMIAMVTGAIPVVTIFIPIVAQLSVHYPLQYDLWIALALGANLGGNGTVTGHLANVMCFEMVNKEYGNSHSFLDFMKIGFPSAIISLGISNLYLVLRLVLFG